jgi:hypothetical protein
MSDDVLYRPSAITIAMREQQDFQLLVGLDVFEQQLSCADRRLIGAHLVYPAFVLASMVTQYRRRRQP